jgi:parallel beta-helix repeat protein
MFLTLILATALLLAINIKPHAMGGEFPSSDWNEPYGWTGNEAANSVARTNDGGYALAGYTTSSVAGDSDFWLVKTNSSGGMEWNRTYGEASEDIAFTAIQTGDGGYALAGHTYSSSTGYDFWLVKTDLLGNMEWNKTYGGSGTDQAYSMVEASDGGYVLAGHTKSSGAGLSDFWLVRTDPTGTLNWSRPYGGSKTDIAHSVARTGDGGYVIVGRTQSYGAGLTDAWLIKTDSSGIAQWNKTYGEGTRNEAARSVAQSLDGGYALTGDTALVSGDSDFWLVKTDSSGNMEWNRTYGGEVNDFCRSITQTGDRGYALAGSTNSFGAGNSDFWLVKTDSLGKAQWNKTLGGTETDVAFSVVQTTDEGYALAGSTSSFSVGGSDFWLVKLTPSPIHICADGSIAPSAAPIIRSGDVYTLTDTVYASAFRGIVIERNNTTLDGAGYLLHGTGDDTGVLVQGRNNVTIKNITIRTFSCGINLSDSLNNSIQTNDVRNCEMGIGLFDFSSGNSISGNNMTAIKGYGIHIDSSSSNVLTGNNILDNDGGIRLLQCTNLVYHNNFINNSAQVSTLDSMNVWDNGYPSGGNYWSDYVGVDVDGDGIGDSPYVADAGNQDNHPLMTPYPYFSGDVNRDGTIDQLDLEMLNVAYGSTPTSTNWHSNADANNDKIINVQDLRILGKNFGKTTKQ